MDSQLSVESLPIEVLNKICKLLTVSDIFRICSINTYFSSTVFDNVWCHVSVK